MKIRHIAMQGTANLNSHFQLFTYSKINITYRKGTVNFDIRILFIQLLKSSCDLVVWAAEIPSFVSTYAQLLLSKFL